MSSGSTVPDPDPEPINAQNFDFAKPRLFFKNIGKYAATSTYIHVRIPFNFTTVFNTKQAIAGVYTRFQNTPQATDAGSETQKPEEPDLQKPVPLPRKK